jgi:hypothetical protein
MRDFSTTTGHPQDISMTHNKPQLLTPRSNLLARVQIQRTHGFGKGYRPCNTDKGRLFMWFYLVSRRNTTKRASITKMRTARGLAMHQPAILFSAACLQEMVFRSGDRVEAQIGDIIEAPGMKLWKVQWDSGASEDMKSQATRKVDAATALSPQTGAAAASAAGEVLCDVDAVVAGDVSSGSDSDDDGHNAEPNPRTSTSCPRRSPGKRPRGSEGTSFLSETCE